MSLNRSGFLTQVAIAYAIAGPGLISSTMADDTTQSANAPAAPPAKVQKVMKMDQPMAGEMKKEGMMKGDMKKSAEKKKREMKDVMEKEEKAMAGETNKK